MMRTNEAIEKETWMFVFAKMSLVVISLGSCALLLTVLKPSSLIVKLWCCGGLLVLLAIGCIVGVLQTGAANNSASDNKSASLSVSGWLNLAIALTWLFVAGLVCVEIYQAYL